MGVPLLRRRRVMAVTPETVIGTAESLSASDAAFHAFDISINPNIDFQDREGSGSLSPVTGVPSARGGQVSFSTELTGDGTSGIPTWLERLFAGCGFGTTTDVVTPTDLPPAAGGALSKTLTIGVYESGRLKKLRGAMGTWSMSFTAGEKVMIEWTFTGIWDTPVDAATLSPTYPTVAPLRFASSGLTVGGASPVVQALSLDAGNEVVLREDSDGGAAAYHSAVITGRRMSGSINPEADLVANFDWYGDFIGRSEAALALALAGGTGNNAAFAAQALQITNVQDEDRNGLVVDNVEFILNRSASAGTDELSITFS